MNPYEVLGLEFDCSEDEIKKAYHDLARNLHPDIGGDKEKFVQIKEAYDILTDEKRRAYYDEQGVDRGHLDIDEHVKGLFNSLVRIVVSRYIEVTYDFDVVEAMEDEVNLKLMNVEDLRSKLIREFNRVERLSKMVRPKLDSNEDPIKNVITELTKKYKRTFIYLDSQEEILKKILDMIDNFEFYFEQQILDLSSSPTLYDEEESILR